MQQLPPFSEHDFSTADLQSVLAESLSSGTTVQAAVDGTSDTANEASSYNAVDSNSCDDIDFQWNLDWTFDPTPLDDASIEIPNLQDLFDPMPLNTPATRPAMPVPGTSTVLQTPAGTTHGLEADAAVQTLPNLPEPSPHEGCRAEDPWPMEWHACPMEPHFILPPLGHEDEDVEMPSRFFTIPPISDSTRRNLKECLKLPAKSRPWQTVDLDNWPSGTKLDTCIDLYFAHFHPVSHLPLNGLGGGWQACTRHVG